MDTEKHLYVMWRIDGEFSFTDLPIIHKDKSTKELVELCIRMDFENDDNTIEHQISMATDPDHPAFIGYEMPLIMVSADVEFIQT